MLHAIKPMIWQALQTLKEPRETEDVVKRSKLQVLSHNLSAEGSLPKLLKFDTYFEGGEEKVDCRQYLNTFIHDAVSNLEEESKEKEREICVERVHRVCWELCKVQVTHNNDGRFPSLLTEDSTKVWWKIFNTFAEKDNETDKTLYPVVMDWEEVDYWVNVMLRVMGLPTLTTTRQEREVMGSTLLTFQDALMRLNSRLNDKSGMYIRDKAGKPDVDYIEKALLELNTRLFEGIYLNGSLTKVKKGHTSVKWCVLYKFGLGFADCPANVDKTDPKSFIPIDSDTEVEHLADKNGRSIRFQVKNPKDASPLLFEANSISTRNKWLTAIICMKHDKRPDYEKDGIARSRNRLKNRQYEAATKQALLHQKKETKRQVEELSSRMKEEQQRFQAEAESLRSASSEELHSKISEYEGKLQALMAQMQRLSETQEQEKLAMLRQHEMEQREMRLQLDDEIGNVQGELEAEIGSKSRQLTAVQQQNEQMDEQLKKLQNELQQLKEDSAARIQQLEEKVAELTKALEEAREQRHAMEGSHKQQREQLEERVRELETAAASSDQELQQLRSQQMELQAGKDKWEHDGAMLTELRRQLDDESASKAQREEQLAAATKEIEVKNAILHERQKELNNALAAKDSLQKKYEEAKGSVQTFGNHRGPGFDVQFSLPQK